MRLTRKQLRKIMTRDNDRTYCILNNDSIVDPTIDQRLKKMIMSKNKDNQKQSLSLVRDLYPQYEKEIDYGGESIVYRSDPVYKQDYETDPHRTEPLFKELGFRTLADQDIRPGDVEYEEEMKRGLGNISDAFNQVTGRTDITPAHLMMLNPDPAVGPGAFNEILEYIYMSSSEEDYIKDLPGALSDKSLTMIKDIMEDYEEIKPLWGKPVAIDTHMGYEENSIHCKIRNIMKLTRTQLRSLIREFLDIGRDFSIDLGTGDPPPQEPPDQRRGGGSNKIHQLIRINFDPERRFDPSSYVKVAIDMSPTGPFTQMREIYDTFSEQTKQALYSVFPGGASKEDEDNTWKLRDAYINILNSWNEALPSDGNYEYFTVFHPEYASDNDKIKSIELYKAVTGYTPDESLLQDYELVLHSASAMY